MRAYVIITDIHGWDKNISGRQDYISEIKEYMKEIMKIVEDLVSQGYEVIVIFAGDIFHKGFESKKRTIGEFNYWQNYFLILNTLAQVYSVVGNHEISYYQNNPFWYLMEKIESNFIKSIPHIAATELGGIQLLRVVDEIIDGDIAIHFGHYTRKASPISGKTNILISHNSIIEDEIAKVLREKYGRDPLENFIDHSYIRHSYPFKGFEYVFNAHMHRAYSLFTIKYEEENIPPTRLRYLSSIGRTNVNEVNDDDLERVIPIIKTDGKTLELEERKLYLWNRDKAVNETIIEENRRKYENQKLSREIERNTQVSANPVEDINGLFKDLPFFLVAFNSAVQGTRPPELDQLSTVVRRGI